MCYQMYVAAAVISSLKEKQNTLSMLVFHMTIHRAYRTHLIYIKAVLPRSVHNIICGALANIIKQSDLYTFQAKDEINTGHDC